MASIIRPDFKRRGGGRWHRTHISKQARLSWEIPAWVPWCFVGVLLLAAFYLSPSSNQSDAPYQTAATTVHIEVIDGDTVRQNGQVFRLVGFNTPETGLNAQCSSERALAAKATDRLQQLLGEGMPDLQRVACACDPGTEGTRRCNHGRLCGKLTVDGRDVGSILIAEGLADGLNVGQHPVHGARTGVGHNVTAQTANGAVELDEAENPPRPSAVRSL